MKVGRPSQRDVSAVPSCTDIVDTQLRRVDLFFMVRAEVGCVRALAPPASYGPAPPKKERKQILLHKNNFSFLIYRCAVLLHCFTFPI